MAKSNNGEYTWKNCKFVEFKGITTWEALSSKLQEELGVTLVLTGKYELLIHTTEPKYIESIRVWDTTPGVEQFTLKCVLPDNVDPEYFKFKVKSGDEDIEHGDPWSVTLSDSWTIQTITEIAIGEKTAHKVYNSYRWWNQDTQTQESYWPWGCKLETKLDSEANFVRIDKNTECDNLKRYSIPKFYTDNRSVSGYGWYRGAQVNELLDHNTGYQTTANVHPFNTNKSKQMLLLADQLRDPSFTVIANNWQWEKVTEPEIEVKVVDNNIYCNNELIYVLQSGDVLVEYTTTSVTATADKIDKPIGFYLYDANLDLGQTSHYSPLSYYDYSYTEDKWISSQYDRAVYNLRFEPIDTQFYVDITATAPKIENVSSTYTVIYHASAPRTTIAVKHAHSVVEDYSELYKSIVREQDYVIQASFVTTNQNASITEPFENLWRCYTGAGLTINMSLTIPQVPYFSFSPFNNINETISLSQVTASTSTSSTHILGPNGEVERTFNYKNFTLGPSLQCNNKILKRNFTYGAIAGRGIYQRSVLTWYDVLNVYGPSITTATKTGLTDATETFRSYVVWHFQLPPDEITEGTGNGGSVPNATPF